MLSYHNDENLKNLVVCEMKKHQKQDQFIKGTYGEKNGKFKGCAVGCTIDSVNIILGENYDTGDHNSLEKTIGIPEWLSKLQDTLFENLPNDENGQFAVDFIDAIPVGVNLNPVKWKFCIFILKENIDRVLSLPNLSEELRKEVVKSIRRVLNLHEFAINFGEWCVESVAWSASASAAWSAARSARSASRSMAADEAWSASRSMAESAAASAAESAAASAAESAAESAVGSAADAAWSAAWSAARSEAGSASWSVAESAAYKRYADELIRLLKLADVNLNKGGKEC